jgi:hypothetical protein
LLLHEFIDFITETGIKGYRHNLFKKNPIMSNSIWGKKNTLFNQYQEEEGEDKEKIISYLASSTL